jgi:hypothetical protein
MKPVIMLVLLAIVGSLGKALFEMSSGPEKSVRMMRALSWRIGLSVVLFVGLFAGHYYGWIAPGVMH